MAPPNIQILMSCSTFSLSATSEQLQQHGIKVSLRGAAKPVPLGSRINGSPPLYRRPRKLTQGLYYRHCLRNPSKR